MTPLRFPNQRHPFRGRAVESAKFDEVREERVARMRRKWPRGKSWSNSFLNNVIRNRIIKKKEHLRERGMTPEFYTATYSDEDGSVTFNLYNGAGKWVGYQTYKQGKSSKKNNDPRESRYYTYLPSGVDGVFGWECVDYSKTDLYIVEGIFKAAKLHTLGFNAIAVLSNHPKRLKPWFKILKARFNLIGIGDNDPAGQKLVNLVGKGFCSPVDLDEMNDDEVLRLLES